MPIPLSAALLFLAQDPAGARPEPPRLVVLLAIDQLVPEQLARLGSRLEGGLGRFLREGTVFWEATVDYANTETAPGHATFATGCYPARHGIVANVFDERSSGERVYAVADPGAHPVTSEGVRADVPGVSPLHLRAGALGDLLRAANAASKTVAVAGKDRSAVLLGGRKPALALWWDGRAGGFVSSSAYVERLPEFVPVWNAAWLDRASGWLWEVSPDQDGKPLGTAPDDRAGESSRLGRTLPRRLPEDPGALAAAVFSTPLIDYFTLEIATLALGALELGKDDATDVLGISLSGCDVVGHGHGPTSVEVTDLLLRADRELGTFFSHLDQEVGQGRWIACLSSDHGVLELPEALAERGIGARRVGSDEVGEMRRAVEEGLATLAPAGGELGLRYAELGFVFDEAAARRAGLEPAEVRTRIAEAAESAPWVAAAYTLEEILAPEPADPWLVLYARCQCPDRGPDVVLRAEPWLLVELGEGTSHGSPYPYDRRVPLAFLGPGFPAEGRFDAASPTDAVPTLLQALGVPLPRALDGKALAMQ